MCRLCTICNHHRIAAGTTESPYPAGGHNAAGQSISEDLRKAYLVPILRFRTVDAKFDVHLTIARTLSYLPSFPSAQQPTPPLRVV
jgi:hypothetical protein